MGFSVAHLHSKVQDSHNEIKPTDNPHISPGGCTAILFELWFAYMLMPLLLPGQHLILDNAPFHRKNVSAKLCQIAFHDGAPVQVLFAIPGTLLPRGQRC